VAAVAAAPRVAAAVAAAGVHAHAEDRRRQAMGLPAVFAPV